MMNGPTRNQDAFPAHITVVWSSTKKYSPKPDPVVFTSHGMRTVIFIGMVLPSNHQVVETALRTLQLQFRREVTPREVPGRDLLQLRRLSPASLLGEHAAWMEVAA